MLPVEIKVVNKNDEKTLTTKSLHYPEDGIVSISRDCPILNAAVENAMSDFGAGVDSTKVILTVVW